MSKVSKSNNPENNSGNFNNNNKIDWNNLKLCFGTDNFGIIPVNTVDDFKNLLIDEHFDEIDKELPNGYYSQNKLSNVFIGSKYLSHMNIEELCKNNSGEVKTVCYDGKMYYEKDSFLDAAKKEHSKEFDETELKSELEGWSKEEGFTWK